MTWGNPPQFKSDPPKQGKKITPEQLAASGSEDGHQAALFCWAADNVGRYPQLAWLFAIPNGGSRHIAEATKMVAAGTRKGVPDIFLPYASYNGTNGYYGCFIEMKVGKNKPTEEQLEWIHHLIKEYYHCSVCYSWIEARDMLIAYLEGKL